MKNLKELTVKELYKKAQEKGINNRSKMNKQQLIEALTVNVKKNISQVEKAKQFLNNKKDKAIRKASNNQNYVVGKSLDLQFFSEKNQFTEGLNDNQKEAVLTTEGTIQICSVAGSGKTRVLTNRTAHMIINVGINPEEILLTTFTKKASDEMKDRLEKMLTADQLADLTLGTTHSIGYRILKAELSKTDHPQAQAFGKRDGILQGWKHKKLVQDIEKKIENKYKNVFDAEIQEALDSIKTPMYLKYVSNCKNNNISPSEAWQQPDNGSAKMHLYKDFYDMYESEKQVQGVIDFDDMLYLTVRLFQGNNNILKKYQKQFKYLMVDEAQDNNLLQYQLIQMLAYPEYNLFIVGDDDQSMYKFRGASPDSFINFKDSYNNTKQIFLPLNYRSNSDILETANKLIFHNENRIEKRLVPSSITDERSVFYSKFTDEEEEADNIVREIQSLHEEGTKYKNVACLYRTNAQSRAIEDRLIIKGIPYVLHGGVSFYDRAEIKDLLSYFRLAYNTKDKNAFKRIYNKPNRFLGKAFLDKLESINRNDLYGAMSQVTFGRWSKGCQEIKDIVYTINNKLNQGKSLEECLEYIMIDSGYKEWLLGEDFESEADNSKLENILTLEHLLSQFDSLKGLIDHLDVVENNKKISDDAIQLMTIHKSKGLEFEVIFGIGISEGILPHFRALESSMENDNKNPIEEERRLMYVLITRAEKKCFISSIQSYNGRGKEESRFIHEMELLTEEQIEEKQDNVIDIKERLA